LVDIKEIFSELIDLDFFVPEFLINFFEFNFEKGKLVVVFGGEGSEVRRRDGARVGGWGLFGRGLELLGLFE
jgi:hypothetical protein